MNARESMRYVMFGGAAALFVAGGLMIGQVMGAQPLQHVQAAAFQPFDLVAPKQDKPADDSTSHAGGDAKDEAAAPTATQGVLTAPTSTPATASIPGGTNDPATIEPTAVPEDTPYRPTPTTVPTEEPTAPVAEPTDEPTVAPSPETGSDDSGDVDEPTVTPDDGEGETPDPEDPGDPDPGPGSGGGGGIIVQIDPCIINPYGPGCDKGVNPVPPLKFHPCTFTLEPCPGEDNGDDGAITFVPIDPCILVDCNPAPKNPGDFGIGPVVDPGVLHFINP